MHNNAQYYVYILASQKMGTLYIGVTSDLPRRVWEHKNKCVPGFTEKYYVDQLMYYEIHQTAENAIRREKQMKKWNREWKIDLIRGMNPEWRDLYEEICA